MIAHILTDTSLTIIGADSIPKNIPSSHPNWDKILTALNDNEGYDVLTPLFDLPGAVIAYMGSAVSVVDDVLFFKDRPLDNLLSRRILQFMNAGQDGLVQPLIEFLTKVMENPSYRAVQGLFEWVEKSGLPIAPDGDIMAYKIVNANFHDYHTGTFDHTPGMIVEEDRNQCDEDPDRTCSKGLHFCSAAYLPHYYNNADRRVVAVKISPADVVAFPRDYDTAKGRTCRLEVVAEIDREKTAEFFGDGLVYTPVVEENESEGLGEIKVGDRFRTREGHIVEVNEIDHDDVPYPVYTDCGAYTTHGRFYTGHEDGRDLVERIDSPTFTVGQVFKTRGGNEVTVEAVFPEDSDGYVVRMTDDTRRTAKGGFFPGGPEDGDDLIL